MSHTTTLSPEELDRWRQRASIQVEGIWLCAWPDTLGDRCRKPLGPTDWICCPEHERARAAQAERRKADAEKEANRLRQAHLATLEQLPNWAHIREAQATAAVVDRRLLPLAERWAPERRSVLVLGPSGAGKTSAAARAIHRLGQERLAAVLDHPKDDTVRSAFEEFRGTRWITACDVDRGLSAHRLGSGSEAEVMTGAVEASVLVLDELGPERTHQAGALFDLIDRRNKRSRPTIATSGLTAEAFETRYGSGMLRRLTEKGQGALIDLHAEPGRRCA